MTDIMLPPKGQYLREDAIRGGMDLLFFVNTRHSKCVDEQLGALGLGRAHYRVMYFIARRPDLSISALLKILDVTKQSLGRVTRELIDRKLIEQRTGERDRRQRLLRLTMKGAELERALFDQLHKNVAEAYRAAGSDAVVGFWIAMQYLMGAEARLLFRSVQDLST